MIEKLTKDSIKNLLSSRFNEDVHTKLSLMPSPNKFKDIKKASLRIKQALINHEKVAIVGDYDVDGVIASTILSEFFDKIGISYEIYIPNRFDDGYGLNASIIEKLNASLIITVDNGITAVDAGIACEEKGIDLIITDHHSVPDALPKAYAIVNPKQKDCEFPFEEICGAQVAWYLCASLKDVLNFDIDLSFWFDCLGIAIMADMMELRDLNRVLVKNGIKCLNQTKRPAFLAIKDLFYKNEFQSDDISFLIAPLINSSGRMKDAMLSYNFLRSNDYEEAMNYLTQIADLNNLRKEQEEALFNSSLKMVKKDEKIIVVWGEDWHMGVIGIVASRLSRKFKKPAIVFSVDKDKAKGSARSIGEIDILSLISQNSDLLLGFGGHKGAAGASIQTQNLPLLQQSLEKATKNLENKLFEQDIEILGELNPQDVDFELLDILKNFEPYGEKNPRPSFIIKSINVKSNRIIGKNNNHLKLILKSKSKILESLFFNFNKEAKRGDKIDIIFTVSKNEFRGLVTPQLLIKEIL